MWEIEIKCCGFVNLKEDKVDQEEYEPRSTEPEEIITWLNHGCTLHHICHFMSSSPHFCDDHL
ncbi:hypothetical protein HanIR_Chr09g0409911 [Helianthus annuus]|nr:hypothetical protein HanIR_Chr09g0409911 [Helianthus annuus]